MLTDNDLAMLARVVEQYDDHQRPVTAEMLAETIETDRQSIEECLADLESNELLAPAGDGYRPTVTARELLELDLDLRNALVVLEFDDRSPDGQTDDGSGQL
jgi:predicted transcriptional regulator